VTDWIHSQEAADEAWDLRYGWQGRHRPWIYGEPCPAQMRDRLAPEWRHFDAKGQPHYENAVGLPTGGEDESLRVDAAPAHCAPRSGSSDPQRRNRED
jgi:hypothetical protein